jgi:hypothetical protein
VGGDAVTRWVELRRHSFTKKDDGRGRGSHLSQAGVDAARVEGQPLAEMRYVAVSESPRALETAIAMGFAVDEVVGIAGANVTGEVGFHEWWEWSNPWVAFAERIAARPKLASYAEAQVAILRRATDVLGDGDVALLIGHGGWIEPTVVSAVGADRIENWGPSFQHLEGVRLSEDAGTFNVTAVHRRE